MDINPFVVLELWRKAMLELVKKDAASADLSARQTAVLLNVYLTPAPHTVRALAVDLNISKPAVTRAVDRLSVLGLIERKPDETDRRSVLLERTMAGAKYVTELGDIIAKQALDVCNPLL